MSVDDMGYVLYRTCELAEGESDYETSMHVKPCYCTLANDSGNTTVQNTLHERPRKLPKIRKNQKQSKGTRYQLCYR